jgi:SAM-dependent methyltransferase
MSAMPPWPGFARRLRHSRARPSFAANGLEQETTVAFRCNLCGRANRVAPARIGRELPSCDGCGSTVRFRTIARLVTREALGSDAALCDMASDRRIRGLGLSDAEIYAKPLARAFAYENTYFHASPRLDIRHIPEHRRGRYDFLIASDVFEHVAPPIDLAFRNAHALLAAGGIFIFSAPFTLADDTVEHFPDLHDWRLEERDGRWRVVNTTRERRLQTFDDPVFHGGSGMTLEMRRFSRTALIRHLERAGFARIRIADEPCATSGIAWPEPFSVPMIAYAQ